MDQWTRYSPWLKVHHFQWHDSAVDKLRERARKYHACNLLAWGGLHLSHSQLKPCCVPLVTTLSTYLASA